jgi:hypothetical protein
VLDADWDAELGANDLDLLLAHHFADKFSEKTGLGDVRCGEGIGGWVGGLEQWAEQCEASADAGGGAALPGRAGRARHCRQRAHAAPGPAPPGPAPAAPRRKVPKAMAKLRRQVRRTKEILSANTDAPFNVEELHEGRDFSSSISRADFEAMAEKVRGAWGPGGLSCRGWQRRAGGPPVLVATAPPARMAPR